MVRFRSCCKRGKPQPKSEPRMARMGRAQLLQCGNSLRPIRAIRGKKIFAKIQKTRH